MAIYCVVTCDRCGARHGNGDTLWIDEMHARAAVDSDEDWHRIDDEDVCPDCWVDEGSDDDDDNGDA